MFSATVAQSKSTDNWVCIALCKKKYKNPQWEVQLEDWEQKCWTSQLELLSQLVISSQQDLYSIIWNPYGNYCKEWQQMVLAFGGKDEENSVEQFVTSSSSWSLTSTSQVPRPSCVELGNLININHHGGEKHS